MLLPPALVCLGAGVIAVPALVPMVSVAEQENDVTPPAIVPPQLRDQCRRKYPGLQNVVAYHKGYYSGSVPNGEAGFETLSGLGVRTIISVDGAIPDVAAAALRGMRYIHLPIGYNGFDEQRRLELARASRDAIVRGAVYVHCHHGKHRSAAAAGTVAVTLGWATPEEMIARMRVSGTSPTYKGLYSSTANASAAPMEALDAVDANFRSMCRPAGLVRCMVEIDEIMDHLNAIKEAAWLVPPDHPDIVPAAEAGRLVDLLRFLEHDHRAQAQPARFMDSLRASRDAAQRLEDALMVGASSGGQLSNLLGRIAASCTDCHASFRD